eukprot:7359657-Alexandrium_andersonii.AAC.1
MAPLHKLGYLHCEAPNVQSAIRPMLVSAAIRPDPHPPCRTCKTASGVRTWNCAGPGTPQN